MAATDDVAVLRRHVERAFDAGKAQHGEFRLRKGAFLEDLAAEVLAALGWQYHRTAARGGDGGRDLVVPCHLFGCNPPYIFVEVEFRRGRVSRRNAEKLVTLTDSARARDDAIEEAETRAGAQSALAAQILAKVEANAQLATEAKLAADAAAARVPGRRPG